MISEEETISDDENAFRLGMNAGGVFAEKVDKYFEYFAEAYETADPNFKDEAFRDGFWKGFIDNVEFAG